MEATAGYTPGIAERVKAFLASNKMTIEALASDVSYSRPTLSRYLGGKYPSDPTEIEAALLKFLEDHEASPTPSQVSAFPMENVSESFDTVSLVRPPAFFESVDAKNALGICAACQKYARMGQIIAKSGFGKSCNLAEYAKMPRVAYIRCNAIMGHRDLVRAIENALGIPRSYGSVTERVEGITKFFAANEGYLIVVDEADKLLNKNTQTKMDTLRDIYDQTRVGIVLAGEIRLKHLIAAYLDRMENRIVYHYEMVGLSARELDKYLDGIAVEPTAMSELQRRAYGDKKGCFRLLDITLSNVFDLMEKTGADAITAELIGQASNWMPL